MTIEFTCEHCGKKHTVSRDMADTAMRCECGKWVVARETRGRIQRAVSRALRPIEFGKSVLGIGRKETEPSDRPSQERDAAPAIDSGRMVRFDKSFLVIAPPEEGKDSDWAGLISKHVMTGKADEATAYAYTRQGKEAHDKGEYAETLALFETARDCYGQHCQALTRQLTQADGAAPPANSEKLLSDLEKSMYNFAVLICATRIPLRHESASGKGKTRLLLEELALAAKILKRPKGFWECTVVFARNKERLVSEIDECFARYGLVLTDFLGESK